MRISVFVISSALAAVGGIMISSYTSSVSANAFGGNTLLLAVGAAVIGGTSLFGGRGRIVDAIIGGAVVEVIYNGFSDLFQGNNNAAIQLIAVGLALAARRHRRRAVAATSRRVRPGLTDRIGRRPMVAPAARPDAMRRHNLALILAQVHRDGALTRAELTARLGLSRSTIGALVADLVDLGLVQESVPTRRHARRPPSHVVGPHPDGPFVVAVDVDVTHMTCAAVGLGGALLARQVVEFDRAAGARRRRPADRRDRARARAARRVCRACRCASA